MNCAIMLQTFIDTDWNLGREALVGRVNGGTNNCGETRIYKNLATDDNEHTIRPRPRFFVSRLFPCA